MSVPDAPSAAIDRRPMEDLFAPLAATIEAERIKLGAPGAVVIVRKDGETAFARGFGTNADSDKPLRTSTLFRVSSTAKVWTAIAALRLVDEGKLSLDTKVTDVLPAFALSGTPVETSAITLRHLLSHRSGISDGEADSAAAAPMDDAMLGRWVPSAAFASTYSLMTSPGRTFNYTNTGFTIVGRMLEQVTGKTYREIVKEKVFGPLGMSRVLCTPDEIETDGDYATGRSYVGTVVPQTGWSPIFYPSGMGSACHASADDLAKLAQFLLDGDARVLSPASFAAMRDFETDPENPWTVNRYHGYAYGKGLASFGGIALDGSYYPLRLVGHEGNGRGFVAMTYVVPEQKLTFVALANGEGAYLDESLSHALRLAGLPAPAPMPPRGVDPAIYPQLVGTYQEPRKLGTITIREMSGTLFADISGLGITGRKLTPEHLRRFELLDVHPQPAYYDHDIAFVPDATGAIELIRNQFWIATRVTP